MDKTARGVNPPSEKTEIKLSKRVSVHNMQGLKATYEHKLAPISKRKFLMITINIF